MIHKKLVQFCILCSDAKETAWQGNPPVKHCVLKRVSSSGLYPQISVTKVPWGSKPSFILHSSTFLAFSEDSTSQQLLISVGCETSQLEADWVCGIDRGDNEPECWRWRWFLIVGLKGSIQVQKLFQVWSLQVPAQRHWTIKSTGCFDKNPQ